MDLAFHHLAHRAFVFTSFVQLYGAFDFNAVIELLECCSWCFEFTLHVFETKQLHQQISV